MKMESSESDDFMPHFLPQYTYVPGLTSRPTTMNEVPSGRFEDNRQGQHQWARCLFNCGFYWEAHEAWEALWILAGRSGLEANCIKGLIKLAACGVKALEGNSTGAHRHAVRAEELFESSLSLLLATEGNSREEVPPVSWRPEPDQVIRLMLFSRNLTRTPLDLAESVRRKALTGGVPVLGQLPDDSI